MSSLCLACWFAECRCAKKILEKNDVCHRVDVVDYEHVLSGRNTCVSCVGAPNGCEAAQGADRSGEKI